MLLTAEHREKIEEIGWCTVEDVDTQERLVEVAGNLGRPIIGPTGDLIKVLRPTSSEVARPGTFSANHGRGSFPYHTDTAFWLLPARYIILRALSGDLRRPTYVLPVLEFCRSRDPKFEERIPQAVWLLDAEGSHQYCLMNFYHKGRMGFRFDPNCMKPSNSLAAEIASCMGEAKIGCGTAVSWEANRVLIVDNWRMMHARGEEPANEGHRVLERIYISNI